MISEIRLTPFDATGVFQPVGGTDGVRRLAVRGAGITMLSGWLGLIIQIVSAVVLARLLTPKDFGVVTMVITFSVLLMNFGLNGFTEAVIQREELTHELVSTLFWINFGAGCLLTIGFAAAGSLLAWFYRDARVERVALAISLTIIATSASVLHMALLKRAMQFAVVSANDLVSRAISVLLAIVLGWAGFGYWALVWAAVSIPVSATIGAWWLCRWIPGRPRRVAGTGSVVRFAINTYGRFSVNYFARNMDNVLVGWRFNAQSLGYYKKAYDLFALSAGQLVTSLTVVAVAALSRLNRDHAQYKRYLLNALGLLALVGMGLSADLTLVGKDLTRLLLGPKWGETGLIFTFFGPGIGAMILYYTHGWIHLSIGRADRWFRWGLIEFIVTGLLFLLGLHWGPVGIAVAWTVSFWILTIPALWYAGRPIQLGIAPVIAVVWKYLLASLTAGVTSALLVQKMAFLSVATGAVGAAVRLVLISLLFGVLYAGGIVALHGGFGPLLSLVALMREMTHGNRLSKTSSPLVTACGEESAEASAP